ncbi:MAG: hypothetical protein RMJ55_12180 [Roseiflexaceae bacterium]|nr:hypothetical protein [Roseiflexus sp.]MDW8214308.1 hypothetical protein [Roseiflexaceae bacterium]
MLPVLIGPLHGKVDTMTVDDITRNVQFMLDRNGRLTAVVLTPELWRQILDALEEAEDRALIRMLRERILVGPDASAALRWEDVVQDWT